MGAVFLDQRLAGGESDTIFEMLRNRSPGLPIVWLGAKAHEDHHGATSYFLKQPVIRRELYKTLQKIDSTPPPDPATLAPAQTAPAAVAPAAPVQPTAMGAPAPQPAPVAQESAAIAGQASQPAAFVDPAAPVAPPFPHAAATAQPATMGAPAPQPTMSTGAIAEPINPVEQPPHPAAWAAQLGAPVQPAAMTAPPLQPPAPSAAPIEPSAPMMPPAQPAAPAGMTFDPSATVAPMPQPNAVAEPMAMVAPSPQAAEPIAPGATLTAQPATVVEPVVPAAPVAQPEPVAMAAPHPEAPQPAASDMPPVQSGMVMGPVAAPPPPQPATPTEPAAMVSQPAQPAAPTAAPPVAASPGLRKMKVLAAEDNKTNRLVFGKMVKDLNIELEFAHNGLQAVEKFQSFKPDMIFMDISMPEMDGKEATRTIRELEQSHNLGHVPVVALTAHAMTGDDTEILAAGLDHYLTKPLRKAAICGKITELAPTDVQPVL
ncbi:MAG: hypothetical protein CSA68_02870 [Rhodobacterales bacterium]|nr:MAG: hypothetical protein CSA68_02870 [Rhodobacterales bacterium]